LEKNSNISQELFETIERYINNTMDAQELKDFNQLLDVDDTFKLQVEDIKNILLGIEAQSLKEQLDDFHKETPKFVSNKSVKKPPFLFYSKIAAAAAIIIAVGSICFFSSSPNQRLYANYFKPDPGLPTTMGLNDHNFDFYNAMVYYKHGDYKLAIDKWKVLSEKKPNNDTINYFLGVANLAIKNVDEAIPLLERSIQSKDSFGLINDAYYYLGLAYLKVDNTALAKKNFNLSNTNTSKEIMKLLD
jgi:tetratricopeptide (TPR) repeat protein